jgi:plasmid segregation protein ParM
MVYEYKGSRGFAGALAEQECEYAVSRTDDTKAHEDTIIRTLLALHTHCSDTEFRIVVGQPISTHTKNEKQQIVDMLQGVHEFTLNGITKHLHIREVKVAAEGAAAYWCNPKPGKIHLIDMGGSTVNLATLIDGKYVDRDSWTLGFGFNTVTTKDFAPIARRICLEARKKWSRDEPVYIVGGIAQQLLEHVFGYFNVVDVLNAKYQPQPGTIRMLPPVYANAVAFFNIAREVYKYEIPQAAQTE